jgi:hypothetical protein
MIMSIIKGFDDALDFHPADDHRPGLADFARTLGLYWTGICEGLAAARTYYELTRRGVSHDEAVHRVFDEHFGD